MRLLGLLLACALAGGGCVRSAAARGTGWWRVTTDHVHLTTDVDRDRAVTAGWAFEDLSRALASVFPACGNATIGDPFEVTMLAHRDEFDGIAPVHSSGYYQHERGGLIASPARLVVPATSSVGVGAYTQIFLHEMAHRFVDACYGSVPVWLNEGIATFFETLRVREHELELGIAPFRLLAAGRGSTFVSDGLQITPIARSSLEPPSQVAREGSAAFRAGGQTGTARYASVWALVHMMMLGPDAVLRARFLEGLTALHERRESWLRETETSLDAPFAAYVDGGRLVERHTPYTPSALTDPIPLPMSPGEAHLILASLEMARGSSEDRARTDEHIALARAEGDTFARAELMRLQLGELHEGETQGSVVAALVAAHPDEREVIVARARRVLAGDIAGNGVATSLAALRSRSDLDAQDLVVEAGLALALQDWDLAIAIVTTATQRDPGSEHARSVMDHAMRRSSCPVEPATEPVIALGAIVDSGPDDCLTPEQRQRRRQGLQ